MSATPAPLIIENEGNVIKAIDRLYEAEIGAWLAFVYKSSLGGIGKEDSSTLVLAGEGAQWTGKAVEFLPEGHPVYFFTRAQDPTTFLPIDLLVAHCPTQILSAMLNTRIQVHTRAMYFKFRPRYVLNTFRKAELANWESVCKVLEMVQQDEQSKDNNNGILPESEFRRQISQYAVITRRSSRLIEMVDDPVKESVPAPDPIVLDTPASSDIAVPGVVPVVHMDENLMEVAISKAEESNSPALKEIARKMSHHRRMSGGPFSPPLSFAASMNDSANNHDVAVTAALSATRSESATRGRANSTNGPVVVAHDIFTGPDSTATSSLFHGKIGSDFVPVSDRDAPPPISDTRKDAPSSMISDIDAKLNRIANSIPSPPSHASPLNSITVPHATSNAPSPPYEPENRLDQAVVFCGWLNIQYPDANDWKRRWVVISRTQFKVYKQTESFSHMPAPCVIFPRYGNAVRDMTVDEINPIKKTFALKMAGQPEYLFQLTENKSTREDMFQLMALLSHS